MISTLKLLTATATATVTMAVLSGCTPDTVSEKDIAAASQAETPAAQHEQPVKKPHAIRSAAETARDMYRHPAETLIFFGVESEHTVVEIWPSSGWYTAILAPYLRQHGQLIAAHFPIDSHVEFFRQTRQNFQQRFLTQPEIYGNIRITELAPPAKLNLAQAGEADRVLTFRNVHNWMRNNQEQNVFDAAYRVLKPGGILGVVEHRAPANFNREQMVASGYVSVAYVTQLAINSGFQPVGQSEVNANPKDTRDHINGVWSLPPSLRGGDTEKGKFMAIGESDRMTLTFRKP